MSDENSVTFSGPDGLQLLAQLILAKRKYRRHHRLCSISGPVQGRRLIRQARDIVEFGVEPTDSAELQKLRSAIDDLLQFPDAATEQDGDFVAAVQFTAQELARLKAENQTVKAERDSALESRPWATGIECDFCGGPIPLGGEGHPQICPSCIKHERTTEVMRDVVQAADYWESHWRTAEERSEARLELVAAVEHWRAYRGLGPTRASPHEEP